MSVFRVLMVCTANYCRSPIGEQLLRRATLDLFGDRNSWAVESAGTDAAVDRGIHELSARVLLDRGAFVEGHRSRMIDRSMIGSADLVLTSAREHRSAVVRMLPGAIGRTFTIRQFARLSVAVPPLFSADASDLGRQLLVEAKAARGTVQPGSQEQDDLPDPMGRPLAAFEACAVDLDAAVAAIMAPLHLRSPEEAASPAPGTGPAEIRPLKPRSSS